MKEHEAQHEMPLLVQRICVGGFLDCEPVHVYHNEEALRVKVPCELLTPDFCASFGLPGDVTRVVALYLLDDGGVLTFERYET